MCIQHPESKLARNYCCRSRCPFVSSHDSANTYTEARDRGTRGGGGIGVWAISATRRQESMQLCRARDTTRSLISVHTYTHITCDTHAAQIYINQYGWCWFVEWQRAKWIEQSWGVQHIDDIVFALHKSIHRHRRFMSWGRAVDIWIGGWDWGETTFIYVAVE